MDKDQDAVYKMMQLSAFVAMALFAAGLFAASYYFSSSNHAPLDYSKQLLNSQWPADLSVQPQPEGITLVSFWAHWCTPCLEEIPAMVKFADRIPNLHIVFVNADLADTADFEKAKLYDKIPASSKVSSLFDPEHKLKKAVQLTGLPTHFLLDKNSKILWTEQGQLNWLDPKIKTLFTEFVQ